MRRAVTVAALALLLGCTCPAQGRALQSDSAKQQGEHSNHPHARAALYAALHANMEMLSTYAEMALEPGQRATFWAGQGHIGQLPSEIMDYARIGSQPGVKTICEIGFNAGHSAAVFLTVNPHATLYSFDYAELPYSSLSLALFRRTYKDRFHWVHGSSHDTVPWFRTQNITCDVFSVDGDHSHLGALTDMLNAIKVMRVGSWFLADDISTRFGCKQAWLDIVKAGYVKEVGCADNGPEDEVRNTEAGIKRWCWGQVISLTGPLDDRQATHPPNIGAMATLSLDPHIPALSRQCAAGRIGR